MRIVQRVQAGAVGRTARLSGWGANLRTECLLVEPSSPRELAQKIDPRGTIARGLGRSYGDAALNTGGQVVGMSAVECYLGFDAESGTLTCEAGVSLAQIIHDFAPRGWFPAVTPGTKFVTVGGCIANDVHGKAHHSQGSFASSVESITVLLANGEVVRASRTENPDLFWGSFGGMGLLGIVLTATLRLRKIETTYFRQRAVRVENLEAMLDAFEEHKAFTYSVATLDVLATGKHLGRGVLALGEHAALAELPWRFARVPLAVSGPPGLSVPFELPEFVLNPLSIRLINATILQIQANAAEIGHYEGFFYPLDMLANWNRAYGKRGFTQYQFVIPLESGPERLRALLSTILSSGELPFLNVLKRLGKANDAPLSFPLEGYTFAIDFPIRTNTVPLLRKLDAMVRDAGGRIYLGKDSFVEAPMFRAMYPALDRFLALKAKYDPENVFSSDLARRVGLLAPERVTG